jgi:hypothetical protein
MFTIFFFMIKVLSNQFKHHPRLNSSSNDLKGVSYVSLLLFFFINMGVRASLRVTRLIPRVLKLTTM